MGYNIHLELNLYVVLAKYLFLVITYIIVYLFLYVKGFGNILCEKYVKFSLIANLWKLWGGIDFFAKIF